VPAYCNSLRLRSPTGGHERAQEEVALAPLLTLRRDTVATSAFTRFVDDGADEWPPTSHQIVNYLT
jgi:hypothetical protein